MGHDMGRYIQINRYPRAYRGECLFNQSVSFRTVEEHMGRTPQGLARWQHSPGPPGLR